MRLLGSLLVVVAAWFAVTWLFPTTQAPINSSGADSPETSASNSSEAMEMEIARVQLDASQEWARRARAGDEIKLVLAEEGSSVADDIAVRHLHPIAGELSSLEGARIHRLMEKFLERAQKKLQTIDESDESGIAEAMLNIEQGHAAIEAMARGSYIIVPPEEGDLLPTAGLGQSWVSPCMHNGEEAAVIFIMPFANHPRLHETWKHERRTKTN